MSTAVSPRERLLDAADALMPARGYEAVGVAELCKTAVVNKGSFYHFFESKQALALEMVDRSWQRTASTIFAASLDDPAQGGLEAIETYGNLLVDGLERLQADCGAVVGCPLGNLAVELSTRNETIRTRVAEIFDEMVISASCAIGRGIALGELSATTDVAQAATDVITHVQGLILLAKARRDPSLPRHLGPTMRRLLT